MNGVRCSEIDCIVCRAKSYGSARDTPNFTSWGKVWDNAHAYLRCVREWQVQEHSYPHRNGDCASWRRGIILWNACHVVNSNSTCVPRLQL